MYVKSPRYVPMYCNSVSQKASRDTMNDTIGVRIIDGTIRIPHLINIWVQVLKGCIISCEGYFAAILVGVDILETLAI